MNTYNSFSRSGSGGYQLIRVPKKRMKVVFIGGNLRRYLGNLVYEPARQKSIVIIEGNLLDSSATGYSRLAKNNAQPTLVGYLKGKGTLEIARDFKRKQNPDNEKDYSAKRYSVKNSIKRLSDKEDSDDYETEEAHFAQSSWI